MITNKYTDNSLFLFIDFIRNEVTDKYRSIIYSTIEQTSKIRKHMAKLKETEQIKENYAKHLKVRLYCTFDVCD